MANWKKDFFVSIAFILFSGFVFLQSFSFPEEASLFPQIFSGLLAFLSVILLIGSLMKKKNEEDDVDNKVTKKSDYRGAISIVLGLFIYAFVLDFFGYIISTFLLVAYVVSVLGYRNIKNTIVTSVISVCCVYVVFKIILGVRLPNIFLF
jgi:putative tricarboxylic transport membrane protein